MLKLENTTLDTYDCTAYYFRDITIMLNDTTVFDLVLPTNIYGGISLVGNV